MFKRVGVASRLDREDAVETAARIVGTLNSRGLETFVEEELLKRIRVEAEAARLEDMDVDLMVVVGGDGTILRVCMLIPKADTPILGVNAGTRGFLAEVGLEEAEDAVLRVLSGEYWLEDCMKLESEIVGRDVKLPDALNELLVASRTPGKTIRFRLLVDGEEVVECSGDAVMAATPTGSTAYSLSAGGPILEPGQDAILVTTVCPVCGLKPLVIPPDRFVEFEFLKPEAGALIIVDGVTVSEVRPGDTVVVRRSGRRVRFVRFESFYSRLRRKLLGV